MHYFNLHLLIHNRSCLDYRMSAWEFWLTSVSLIYEVPRWPCRGWVSLLFPKKTPYPIPSVLHETPCELNAAQTNICRQSTDPLEHWIMAKRQGCENFCLILFAVLLPSLFKSLQEVEHQRQPLTNTSNKHRTTRGLVQIQPFIPAVFFSSWLTAAKTVWAFNNWTIQGVLQIVWQNRGETQKAFFRASLTPGDRETLLQSNHRAWHSKRSTEPPPQHAHTQTLWPPSLLFDSLFNCIVSICEVATRLSSASPRGIGDERQRRETLAPANQNANIRLPIGVLVHLGGWISRL